MNRISLNEILNLIPYSKRHINRIFKKELNISIFKYIKLYRILMASIKLNTEDKSVKKYCL